MAASEHEAYLELCGRFLVLSQALQAAARGGDWDRAEDLLRRRGDVVAAARALGVAPGALPPALRARAGDLLERAAATDQEVSAALQQAVADGARELQDLYRVRDGMQGYLQTAAGPGRAPRFLDNRG